MVILKTGLEPVRKRGKLVDNGVMLEKHEMATVIFFLERGFDVELIQPSNVRRMRKPDIFMAGLMWEMKAPQGLGKNTIDHIFKKAARQSENIIIDFRQYSAKIAEKRILIAERRFKSANSIRRMCIITSYDQLIYFTKKS